MGAQGGGGWGLEWIPGGGGAGWGVGVRVDPRGWGRRVGWGGGR